MRKLRKYGLGMVLGLVLGLALTGSVYAREGAVDGSSAVRAKENVTLTHVKLEHADPKKQGAVTKKHATKKRHKSSDKKAKVGKTSKTTAYKKMLVSKKRTAVRSNRLNTKHTGSKKVSSKKESSKYLNSKHVSVSHGKTVLTHSRSSVGKYKVARAGFVAQPPRINSSIALVYDQKNHQVLFSKNSENVVPIASITKLMTGLLISQANLDMSKPITITEDDVDTIRHSSSRLRIGVTLPRSELLHLALMSSENRAASALARTFPGGEKYFVALMNEKARSLGMMETRYVEPTGLSSQNRSTARDLAVLVAVAAKNSILRQLTTSLGMEVDVSQGVLQYRNSNQLVRKPSWDISLQKTGFITEAGHCMVLETKMADRKIIMILLDANNNYSRMADAEKIRRWVELLPPDIFDPKRTTAMLQESDNV